jgi:hypothetical protein
LRHVAEGCPMKRLPDSSHFGICQRYRLRHDASAESRGVIGLKEGSGG